MRGERMILASHAKKYYGSIRGIEDLSLEVKSGEIFGFVGPNGSGKTTFIRSLLGLLKLDSGTIHLLSKEVKVGEQDHFSKVGYMPSESFFFNELKVKDILKFFQSTRPVDPKYLEHLIEHLDVDLNKKFGSLSFGNKKKIGIIVAMMHQPEVLILDEPTAGLDPLIQSRFLELLVEQKMKGTTVLLSSHVLKEIEKVCDRVALIKEGSLLFTRRMEDIRKEESKRVIVWPNHQNLVLEGLTYLRDENGASHYAYQGDVNLLMRYLSSYHFKDMVIRNIDLEELFQVFYERGDV
jgi:ABC-2 type transport system ATP-binding protein